MTVTDGFLETGSGRVVHLERTYDVSTADVWRAWTDPERLARWLGTPDGELLGSGPARLRMGDEPDQVVEIEALDTDPERALELAWRFEGAPDSRLRIALAPTRDGGTRLVLDHGGLGASTTGYGAGWQAFLDGPLAAELGGASAGDWETLVAHSLPLWRERAAALESAT